MDDIVDAQFRRIESALKTLVDSIASFNPSPQAAADLIAADDELSRGLDQLTLHQANHARIQTLRADADALEHQLKSSVATLAGLRRELFATPATIFPDDALPVPLDELLQYAKNIAPYTVPPTYRERIPSPSASDPEKESDGPLTRPASGPASNGVSTPTQQPPRDGTEGLEKASGEAAVAREITTEEAEWLSKLKANQHPWQPWPADDKIRNSNLMQIQYLLDTKQDPTQIDATKMGREERERIAAEAAKEAAAQQQMEPLRPAVAREEVTALRRPEPEPQQFAGFGFVDEEE